ncbi:hypothetical protein ACFL5O_00640 [Myxococcota bacterium]
MWQLPDPVAVPPFPWVVSHPDLRVSCMRMRIVLSWPFSVLAWACCALRRPLGLGLLLTLGGPIACSQQIGAGAQSPTGAGAERELRIVHDPCDTARADEKLDANGDGKPEVSIVKQDGRTHCFSVDFNSDGRIDQWVYLDPSGVVRRREFALGVGPHINKIEMYKGGQLVSVHKSTLTTGKVDTWQQYNAGKLVQSERDSDGDGQVDQWWDYRASTKPNCPMMYADSNKDGKPDHAAGVNLCGGGYVPPERPVAQKPKSPDFTRQGVLPTEGQSGEQPGASPVPQGQPSSPSQPTSTDRGK